MDILDALGATAEIMGAELSPSALAMMARDFSGHSEQVMAQALKNVRLKHTRFSAAAIQKELDELATDGRLSANEAWGLYPHDESTSAVISEEMAEAMQSARPLLDEGDKIAARMAFKEAYERIVLRNKSHGIPVKWFPSMGSDPAGREIALTAAVQLGRIGHNQAQALLPTPKDSKLMQHLPEMRLLTQKQDLTDEQKAAHEKRMNEIRDILKGNHE